MSKKTTEKLSKYLDGYLGSWKSETKVIALALYHNRNFNSGLSFSWQKVENILQYINKIYVRNFEQ